jgi:hypothetical protein
LKGDEPGLTRLYILFLFTIAKKGERRGGVVEFALFSLFIWLCVLFEPHHCDIDIEDESTAAFKIIQLASRHSFWLACCPSPHFIASIECNIQIARLPPLEEAIDN